MTAWVFDLDGCLVDSQTGTSLRPGALDVLADLRRLDQLLFVWSAGGAAYARQRAEHHGFAHLVHGFHDKESRGRDGRYRTDGFLEGIDDVVFVDDRPEDVPGGADVVALHPYVSHDPHDRALDAVAARIRALSGEAPL